jgi:hypothetical protein
MPVPDKDDIRAYAEELSGAYASFSRQAHRRLATPVYLSLCPLLRPNLSLKDFFRPGSPIYRLLTDDSCRLAMPSATLLLYLNILLWGFWGQEIIELRRFFLYVQTHMDEGVDDTGGTTESLFWTLATDFERRCFRDPPSIWLLTRLVRTSKKLSRVLQLRLEHQLLAFLTGEPDSVGRHFSWTPDAFRSDVLHDLGLPDD